jgi:hypothetical protein
MALTDRSSASAQQLLDDPVVGHAGAARRGRHADHQRHRHAREQLAELSGQPIGAGRAGDHEVAQHRGRDWAALGHAARRPHVAYELGPVAGFPQHLRHEASDVHVVFDDQNDLTRHNSIDFPTSRRKNSGPS